MGEHNLRRYFSTKKELVGSVARVTAIVGSIALLSAFSWASSNSHVPAVAATKVALATTRTPTATPTPTPTVEAPSPAPVDEPVRPQPVTPPGVEAVPDAPQNIAAFTPDAGFTYTPSHMRNVSASDIPSWISYDVNNDNEQVGETETSWNSSLYAYYNSTFGQTYQYEPIEVHAHWWGDPATSPSHDEIVNYIDNKDALTVNFVVSANRITNMMPLTWMATTTGYRNPWAWKMEIDPRLGDAVYETVGALMYVVELKNPRLANEPIRLHKEFYATSCSEIDVAYLRSWVNKFASGEYDISTGQPAVVPPAPSPSPSVSVVPSVTPTASTSPSATPTSTTPGG